MSKPVIYWIRHAESCTNLLDKKVTDRYNSTNNIEKFDVYVKKLNDEEFANYNKNPFSNHISSVNKILEKAINNDSSVIIPEQDTIIHKCETNTEGDIMLATY
jgi:hypothetical protein